MDLALNNLQGLKFHKTQQTKPNQTRKPYLLGSAYLSSEYTMIAFKGLPMGKYLLFHCRYNSFLSHLYIFSMFGYHFSSRGFSVLNPF